MRTVSEILAEIDRVLKLFNDYEMVARKYHDIELALHFNQRSADFQNLKNFILSEPEKKCEHISGNCFEITPLGTIHTCATCGEKFCL